MFLFREPSKPEIQKFLARQHGTFSYRERDSSFTVDHNRIELGHGGAAFARAKSALRAWKMFDLPWVRLCWPTAPVEPHQAVAIAVRHFGFWSLNAARIVYVIDEPARFGFAYGTLHDHAESGEERFSVEMLDDGSVWYDLYAFSRPRAFAARLAYPVSRALQRRFARDSLIAMRRAVHD